MSTKVRCPNCGMYKVATSQRTAHINRKTGYEYNQNIVTGVGDSWKELFSIKDVIHVNIYNHECSLCGYEWEERESK